MLCFHKPFGGLFWYSTVIAFTCDPPEHGFLPSSCDYKPVRQVEAVTRHSLQVDVINLRSHGKLHCKERLGGIAWLTKDQAPLATDPGR